MAFINNQRDDDDTSAGESPVAGKEPVAASTDKRDSEAELRSREAAKYRTQRNEARRKIKELESRLAEQEAVVQQRASHFEAEKQAAFTKVSEVKAMLDNISAENEALKAQRAAEQSRIKSRLLSEHLRSELAVAGVTTRAQQDLLLPALISRVDATLTDDYQVQCDATEVVKVAVAAFGGGQTKEEAPRMTRASMLLANELPGGGRSLAGVPVKDRFREALRSATKG